MSTTRQNHELVRRWFEEVWNKRRAEAIDELLADDVEIYGLTENPNEPLRGKAAFKPFFEGFIKAFPDINVTVEDTIAEGDKVVARCRVRGRHSGDGLGFPASHSEIDFSGTCTVLVKDGKFAAGWNHFDFLKMYQQIGVVKSLG
jgi:steroid delta-isomerase-like uncharacterized protein